MLGFVTQNTEPAPLLGRFSGSQSPEPKCNITSIAECQKGFVSGFVYGHAKNRDKTNDNQSKSFAAGEQHAKTHTSHHHPPLEMEYADTRTHRVKTEGRN